MKLYQKYRPLNLSSIVGHENQVKQIRSWIKKGFPQSVYIAGETGRGKTTLARIIAMSINCSNLTDEGPCGQCESCKSVVQESFNLNITEINASNLNVEAARELDSNSKISSFFEGKKVWIINEFQELSDTPKARKNLLALLENKNDNAHVIITTMDDSKIEDAIIDRCSRIRLKPVPDEVIAAHLVDVCDKEGVELTQDKLEVILLVASNSNGSVRSALSMLEDVIDMGLWDVSKAEEELQIVSDKNLINQVGAILNKDPSVLDNPPSKEVLNRIRWMLVTSIKVSLGASVNKFEKGKVGQLPFKFSVQRQKEVLDKLQKLYELKYVDSFAVQSWIIDCIVDGGEPTALKEQGEPQARPIVRGRGRGRQS